MNKLLNNPIIVILLVIVAVVTIYLNLINPIIDTKKNETIVDTSDITLESDFEDEVMDDGEEGNSIEISRLTYDYAPLSEIGWNVTWDRDPFFVTQPKIIKKVKPINTLRKKRVKEHNISADAIVIGLKKGVILYKGNKYQQGDRLLGGIIVGFNSDFINIQYGNKTVKVKYND